LDIVASGRPPGAPEAQQAECTWTYLNIPRIGPTRITHAQQILKDLQMFNPTRDQARRFFFAAWSKYRKQQPLEGAESQALQIILAHPEYHAMLDQPERYLDRDYPPEFGETNPFLHLSMHLAITEQLSIDQPPGIRQRYETLCTQQGEEMRAQHEIMDCLAEMIWQAQRQGAAFDPTIYFNCLDEKIRRAQAE